MPIDQGQDCIICTEKFNKTTRDAIECIKCDFICCKQCFRRYITDSDHFLRCMNPSCQVEWDRTSLHFRLGATFMRTWFRDIRENLLYEQEKGMFPATQELIETEIQIEKLQRIRDGLDAKFDKIKKERMKPLKQFRYSQELMKVSDALDQYFSLQAQIEIIDEQLEDERSHINEQLSNLRNKNNPTTRTYILSCTNGDCKALLSNESKNKYGNYICSICDGITCCECKMSIPSEDHTCDPNILKTVEYMATTSKPCPSCGVPIHKISGCHQMFCTSCHASFDWTTLRLNNGAVHNPYHAAWLRENRNQVREIGDIQCGREITMEIAVDIIHKFDVIIDAIRKPLSEKEIYRGYASYLFEAMRIAIHHHHVTIPALNNNRHGHHTNQRLRINLLRGFITEEEFRREIQRRDKANSKKNDLMQITITYRDSINDLVWDFAQHGNTKTIQEWTKLTDEVKALEAYVNECFKKTATVYNSTHPYEIIYDGSFR